VRYEMLEVVKVNYWKRGAWGQKLNRGPYPGVLKYESLLEEMLDIFRVLLPFPGEFFGKSIHVFSVLLLVQHEITELDAYCGVARAFFIICFALQVLHEITELGE
jgi:hypothetical protein